MTNARFIKSITTAATTDKTQMPWTRGARRTAFITKRNSTVTLVKSA